MQIQISWLLQNILYPKPTDLDLHCLQRHDISGFIRTRVNISKGSAPGYVTVSGDTVSGYMTVFGDPESPGDSESPGTWLYS